LLCFVYTTGGNNNKKARACVVVNITRRNTISNSKPISKEILLRVKKEKFLELITVVKRHTKNNEFDDGSD
jgi:hypothetical protein